MPAPLVIGHRGAPGYRPEHSEAAYRLAFDLGADLVEPDIVSTRDGVLVVRHENEISGTTDVAEHPEFASRRTTKTIDGKRLTGWFTEDFDWAELQTLRCRERLAKLRHDNTVFDGDGGMLSLVDVLRIIDEASAEYNREFGVVIEIKHAHYFLGLGYDLGEMLLTELELAGWDARPHRVVFESFELGVLDRLREAGAQGELIFLTERAGAPADEPLGEAHERSYAWYRSDEGLDLLTDRVDGISVAKSSILKLGPVGIAVGTTSLVRRAHARGLRVYTWTLRPENFFLSLRFQRPITPAHHGDWEGEFGLILSSGVDGIFVDHPDLGRRAVDAFTAA